MDVKQTTPPSTADLRWPNVQEGLPVGVVILIAISLIMFLIQAFDPLGNENRWLVIIPGSGPIPFPESITAIFTTHFVHNDWGDLWKNMLGFWICGLIAFSIAGYWRALGAISWGIVLAGLVLLISKQGDGTCLGIMPITFAFFGIIVQAAIRKGILFILTVLLIVVVVNENIFSFVQTSIEGASVGTFWLANFFGFVGGLMADLKNPVEAARVLHAKGLISDAQTEKILRNRLPEAYADSVTKEPRHTPPAPANKVKSTPIQVAKPDTKPGQDTSISLQKEVRPEQHKQYPPDNAAK